MPEEMQPNPRNKRRTWKANGYLPDSGVGDMPRMLDPDDFMECQMHSVAYKESSFHLLLYKAQDPVVIKLA